MDIKPYFLNKNIFTKEQIRNIQYTFEKEMLKTIQTFDKKQLEAWDQDMSSIKRFIFGKEIGKKFKSSSTKLNCDTILNDILKSGEYNDEEKSIIHLEYIRKLYVLIGYENGMKEAKKLIESKQIIGIDIEAIFYYF
jgi:hypothetical protein